MTTHYASPGAVSQHGGSLPIRTCKRCGDEICWATSRRTGKAYPVNVTRGYHGQRFYIGRNVHKCDQVLAERAELVAADDRRAKLLATISDAQRAYKAGDISQADYLSIINSIND